MQISLRSFEPESEAEELAKFLSENRWPFHVYSELTLEGVRTRIAEGAYVNEDRQTFWIETPERVGIAVLEDLQDDAPLFDLRLAESVRGQGIAAAALGALTALVFERFPDVRRFEGQTRQDNLAMRRTFLKNGFVKEAHYRQGWPTADGRYLDSVAYAILRQDFETGQTTPVDWQD
ncbi:RimJ/RimL family protein N-acetyltransferase [Psychromicrobium silvestre]|uniref:RimJ/RimL family protein N-acetyltransferase n=1 Tax=Psychromicrobium silvestre TaxID=1645614 RepID=A0A7Y9LVP3_9MICC|nr:GNAT family protein [Psychromicrobium silvestre]NYE96452.1 RimJ/RimL family protein N-acetyltransferase [Psychromicrobium silvestre]